MQIKIGVILFFVNRKHQMSEVLKLISDTSINNLKNNSPNDYFFLNN